MSRERTSRAVVSALFTSDAAVEQAIFLLELRGLPRDRIEVVVSPEGARRWYGRRARGAGRQVLAGAGAGAVIGLLVGAAIALVVVVLPGRNPPTVVLWAQLLGPNAGSMAGALIGAVVGWFLPERPHTAWRRVVGTDAILVLVEGCSPAEAPLAEEALSSAGGTAVSRG